MKNFFADSIRELKHVVWPTHKETQKYFGLVLAILIFFGIYLFAFNTLFKEFVFTLKDIFNPAEETVEFDSFTTEEINNLLMSDEASIEINTESVDATDTVDTTAQEASTEEEVTTEEVTTEEEVEDELTSTGSNQ